MVSGNQRIGLISCFVDNNLFTSISVRRRKLRSLETICLGISEGGDSPVMLCLQLLYQINAFRSLQNLIHWKCLPDIRFTASGDTSR